MSIEAIYSRRSIRKYKADKVPLNMIEKIIEAGRNAPSGKNKQPWKFTVFGGDQKDEMLLAMERGIQRELNEESLLPKDRNGLPDAINTLKIMKKAPIVIMVLDSDCKTPCERITAEYRITEIVNTLSIGAAIQNMLLQAEDLGLGTLWVGNTFFAYEELCSYLETDMQLVGAIAVGYPNEKPDVRPRKPIDSIVEYRI